MTEAFVSWSGGKDCSLACYRAMKNGFNIRYLLNMVSEDGERSWSHGLAAKWLEIQSQAMGIPILQKRTSAQNYEAEFNSSLQAMKKEGVTTGVFGDIDFMEHLKWIEHMCTVANIKPVLPLWQQSQEVLLKEFISSGFEAVIITTRADKLGDEWLGRKIDQCFFNDIIELGKTSDISCCGEAGEYHSLVINGPTFKKRIELTESGKVLKDGHRFLVIEQCQLKDK